MASKQLLETTKNTLATTLQHSSHCGDEFGIGNLLSYFLQRKDSL